MIRRPPRSTPLSLHDALPISLRGRETLRVIYPDDEIVYRELGRGSNTTLRVRDDGTFNDRDERGKHWSDEGRRGRIAGSGGGPQPPAHVRVASPAGERDEEEPTVRRALPPPLDVD